MRLVSRVAVVSLMTLATAACSQVDPILMPVSMPECIYQGPSSMHEGNARVSLTLNGIGDAGVSLVELTGEGTYDDLVMHFEAVDDRWAARPSWASTELELRLDSIEVLNGVEDTVRLDAGDYAIVCIDHPYDDGEATARAAAPIVVRER